MTIRLIPDLLKHGDKEPGLGGQQRTRAVEPMPAVAGPDGTAERAWQEWLDKGGIEGLATGQAIACPRQAARIGALWRFRKVSL